MAFDKEAELNEPAQRFEVVFSSGRPRSGDDLSMPPSAYIAMGWHSSDDEGRIRLTTEEMTVEALETQVRGIKLSLDGCIAEARARFAASNR